MIDRSVDLLIWRREQFAVGLYSLQLVRSPIQQINKFWSRPCLTIG